MTLTRKLALGLCLALLSASYSNSQSLDPATGTELLTTGNLLNLGGGLPWSNTVTGQAGGASGGNVPAYNPGTGNIIFGYTQATVSQSIAINTALANAGLGIQLSGYKYSWQIHNDLTNYASNRGTLTGNVSLTGATGNVLESFSYDYNQNIPTMTSFTGTQFFNNRYTTSQASNLTVSFTGKDQNFWAGYYGPRVHVDDVSLLYTIDPCKLNPAYSPTCSGFGNILNTNNLLDSTQGGSYLNQAFAINTALSSAGVGATVHGFNYGFNYRVGQSWYGCTATNQDGSCSWYMNVPAYANATVSLTNSSNQTIHSKSYSFTGDGTSGSVSDKYLLPSSMNQSLLGTGRIVGSASGTGSSIEGAWATMIYTADPCVANPLYSSNCKGYAFAMAKQLAPQSSSTVTYNDGTQTLDTTTGMPPDPAQPLPPPGSPPPAGSPPPPGSEPPPGSPPPPPGAQQPASNNPAGPPPANQPPPQGGSSSQPKAGEVKTADGGGSKSGPSLGNVMSMISSNQARIGNEAKSVVQAAESAAAQSAQSAQQQAETVASALTTQSISDSTTASSGLNSTTATSNSQTQNSAVALAAAAQTTVGRVDVLKSAAQPVLFDSTAVSSDVVSIGSLHSVANINAGSNTSAGAGNQASQYELFSLRGPTTVDVEVPQFEGIKIGGRSTLNDAIEQRFTPSGATAQEQRTDAVNRNVQPNELAGAVDINNIARQPAGYQAYSVAMPDVAFYAPKEIYRNQVNVDNARVLRQLSSDRLHHDLVNLQYK
jgi:hypothetical protein